MLRESRSAVILLLLALMEVLAGFGLTLGSGLLATLGMGGSAFWLLLLSTLGGLAVGLVVTTVVRRDVWSRLATLSGGLVCAALPAYLTAGGTLFLLAASVILGVFYWRGLTLAPASPVYEEVQARFGIGFAVLFLGLLWAVARGALATTAAGHMLALAGIAYILVALVAMVMARLERVREPGSGPAVALAVILQLGFLLLAALLALQIFSFDLMGALWSATRPFWDAVGSAGFHLISLLARPIDWVVSLIRPHHGLPHRRNPILPPGSSQRIERRLHAHHASNTPLVVAGFICAALILSGIAFLIWRVAPRMVPRAIERGYTEERRTLFTPADLWRALLLWLRSRFARGAQTLAVAAQRTRRHVRGDYPSDPVRRLYVQLLRRAAAAGLPRSVGTTPAEYQLMLATRWPAAATAFTALTDAYILRRYGDVPLLGNEASILKRHWQDIRAAIRLPRVRRPAADRETSPSLPGEPWRTRLIRQTRDHLLINPDTGEARNLLLLIAVTVVPVTVLFILLAALTILTSH